MTDIVCPACRAPLGATADLDVIMDKMEAHVSVCLPSRRIVRDMLGQPEGGGHEEQ